MLFINVLLVLITITFVSFFHVMTSSFSQINFNFLFRIWITIELLKFIKSNFDNIINAFSIKIQTSFSFSDRNLSLSMSHKSFDTFIVDFFISIFATVKNNSFFKQLNSKNYDSFLNVNHLNTSTKNLKNTITINELKMTNINMFVTTEISRKTWTLLQKFARTLKSIFYNLNNLISTYIDSNVIEFSNASTITSFSYFFDIYNIFSNMNIFTKFDMFYYLILSRYVVILISIVSFILLILM